VSGRDVGASVRQRLLNQSRAQGRPFQELLQYFAMERFLYRLAQSPFADRFILKGALLLTAWRAPLSRPTIDIDLAGRTSNELEHIAELVGAVCDLVTEPDVEYPTLLDFPAPVLQAYPRETVVAEKLEALTTLGLLNSRMKDYYDLALLPRMYSFEGEKLVASILATFRHRGTKIESEPIGLTDAFYADPARAIQWRAFIRRSRFVEASGELERLVAEIRQFALPVLEACAGEKAFKARWQPGGPWK
jgi:predicted nucleotidyltransferase component of viral defense system